MTNKRDYLLRDYEDGENKVLKLTPEEFEAINWFLTEVVDDGLYGLYDLSSFPSFVREA